MVAFTIHFDELGFKVRANLGEYRTQSLYSLTVEDAAAVFGHKDQMDVKCKYTMSAVSKVLAFCHRPEYIGDGGNMQETFEVKDKEVLEHLASLPSWVIGFQGSAEGERFQVALDAISFPEPNVVEILGLGAMPFDGTKPETISEVWVAKTPDGWELHLIGA